VTDDLARSIPKCDSSLNNTLDDLDVGLLLVDLVGLVLVAELGLLGTEATDLVPGKLEQLVDALEGSARGLGDGEPSPDTTDEGDGSEEPEGTGRAETALLVVEEHERDGARVTVLVDEMEAHDQRGGHGSDTERVDFSVEEVLHGVPTHSPTETGDVDEHEGDSGSSLLALGELEALLFNAGNSGKEGSEVSHGDGLAGNTDTEGTLATDPVDQEESTCDGSDELDYTENGSCEQLLVLALSTEESEEVGCVNGHRLRSTPLTENLGPEAYVKPVGVVGHAEHFAEISKSTLAHGGFLLLVKLVLDFSNFGLNNLVFDRETTDASQVDDCVLALASLDEVTG
jgi:hypothetical protein